MTSVATKKRINGDIKGISAWNGKLAANTNRCAAFNRWHDLGTECGRWNVPRCLLLNAYRNMMNIQKEIDRAGERWMAKVFLRAYRYGLRALCEDTNYVWPIPPPGDLRLASQETTEGAVHLAWVDKSNRIVDTFALPGQSSEGLDRWFLGIISIEAAQEAASMP